VACSGKEADGMKNWERKEAGWNMTKSQCIWTSLSTQKSWEPLNQCISFGHGITKLWCSFLTENTQDAKIKRKTEASSSMWPMADMPPGSRPPRACWDEEGGEGVEGMAWRCSPAVEGANSDRNRRRRWGARREAEECGRKA
jgi:hypothetical protein